MAVQSENERNKAVVDEYFNAGVQGHLTSFAAYLNVIKLDEERVIDPKKCEYFFSEERAVIK